LESTLANSVELLGFYGSDETHALSAWTSTSRDLPEEKRNRIGPLLTQLAKDGHLTPFEKSSLHFLVTSDIASHIHLLKHRIGVSINAESARYKELKGDKAHVPSDWPKHLQEKLEAHTQESFHLYHWAVRELEIEGMNRKRAKESARFFLPYANQITCDVMFNWRSFAHFLGLRNKPDAQVEIRELAAEMLRLVEATGAFPLTIEALREARLI
jgi:thymidylate synthase (FAD)